MRKIKFRAWDKQKEEMIPPDSEYYICFDGELVFNTYDSVRVYQDIIQYTGYMASNDERFAVMQFTGLKDRNGVEIYEGDIFSHKFYSKNCAVTFRDGCFEGEDVSLHSGSIEVIGNIYETPNLLK